MSPNPSPEGVFTTRRQYPFSAAQIHAAFAHGDRLAAWWGPAGFSNTFETFEFQPQGRWSFVMHGPDGANYRNDCVFIKTSPHQVIIRHLSVPQFTLTVSWAESDGLSTLDWHQAFDDPTVAAHVAHIVLPSNEQNLDRLQTALTQAAA